MDFNHLESLTGTRRDAVLSELAVLALSDMLAAVSATIQNCIYICPDAALTSNCFISQLRSAVQLYVCDLALVISTLCRISYAKLHRNISSCSFSRSGQQFMRYFLYWLPHKLAPPELLTSSCP